MLLAVNQFAKRNNVVTILKTPPRVKIGIIYFYLSAWEKQPGIHKCSIHRKMLYTRCRGSRTLTLAWVYTRQGEKEINRPTSTDSPIKQVAII
jgi:Tfp pilus assembly major pilin PilA